MTELIALEVEIRLTAQRVDQETKRQIVAACIHLPNHLVQCQTTINDRSKGCQVRHEIVC
jgi:hypothetical protein